MPLAVGVTELVGVLVGMVLAYDQDRTLNCAYAPPVAAVKPKKPRHPCTPKGHPSAARMLTPAQAYVRVVPPSVTVAVKLPPTR